MGFIMRGTVSRMLVTSAAQLPTGLPIRERLYASPVIANEPTACGVEAIPFSQNPTSSTARIIVAVPSYAVCRRR